jgi:hypothetical protein
VGLCQRGEEHAITYVADNCWAAERLLVPQERHCSAELFHICSVDFLL